MAPRHHQAATGRTSRKQTRSLSPLSPNTRKNYQDYDTDISVLLSKKAPDIEDVDPKGYANKRGLFITDLPEQLILNVFQQVSSWAVI